MTFDLVPLLQHVHVHVHIYTCSGVPCLCLAFCQPYIVGGFANGQLRLYDSETGVKVIEVSAHARPVTALDVAPSASMVSPFIEAQAPFQRTRHTPTSIKAIALYIIWFLR